MQIKKGNSRLVLIFDRFVVKLPRIYPVIAYRNTISSLRRGYFLKSLKFNSGVLGSVRRLLFRGVIENWLEFVFYRSCRSQFLMPTYVSLFGLLNIQAVGRIAEEEIVENIWCWLFDVVGRDLPSIDDHTFENPNNFAVDKYGGVRIIDYGSTRIHNLIRQYGDQIYKEVNFHDETGK